VFCIYRLPLSIYRFRCTLGQKVSLLSYFFWKFSDMDTYSMVDTSKNVFLLFVCLFSFGLSRIGTDIEKDTDLSFTACVKRIKGKEVLALLAILVLCTGLDFALFKIGTLAVNVMANHKGSHWLQGLFFWFQIYIPMLLFSLTLFRLLHRKWLSLSFKKIGCLLVSLWLFNEFAYEVFVFVRNQVFGFLFIPLNDEHVFAIESFLALPLVAFFMLGYHSAMTTSVRMLAKDVQESI
jgi:hypothetical protein